jgi:hypothetical protein
MKKTRSITFFATLMLFAVSANAQESVNASGGEASGAGGSASFSVGQVVYTTNSAASGSLAPL